jgi:hypothetical protein
MEFVDWIQHMLRRYPLKPKRLTPQERQAFTQGVMQRVHALEAQPEAVAVRSWSWNWALPRLAAGAAMASIIFFSTVWYQRPVSMQPDTMLVYSRDLEVLQAFDALDENGMVDELELLVDEADDMQWMLLAEQAVSSDQERIEQTLEVLDAFDELDLPEEEMDELWIEELDWPDEELDAAGTNARLQILIA